MAMSLERDPQMESLLAKGRKKQLGISMDFDAGHEARAATCLQSWLRPRQRPGARSLRPADLPLFLRQGPLMS